MSSFLEEDEINTVVDSAEPVAQDVIDLANEFDDATIAHVFEAYIQSIAFQLAEHDDAPQWDTRTYTGILYKQVQEFGGGFMQP